MKLKHLYLALAIVGMVVPYYFLVSFFTTHGLDGRAFLQQLFGTRISSFFAVDLLLSSVVFVIYLRHETRRYSIKHWGLYLVALCAVGLSFALPLFLYVREDCLTEKNAT
jgi:Ca2+/H+ antiporter